MTKLSVLIPSYNKREYIREALDSVLRQKTEFGFNLIITDDGSTDGTLDIINEYVRQYPDQIVLLPSVKNEGLLSNIIKAYEYMDCEYFCCLDPDDYYTDDNFYQKAISFLESNREFNIYAANTICMHEDGTTESQNSQYTDDYYDSDFSDMLDERAPLGNTISSVFRNNVINEALIGIMKTAIGDRYAEHSFREDDFRNRIHLQTGKAHWVNEIVGVYRYTPTGLYRSSNLLKKHCMKVCSYLDMYLFFNKKHVQFITLAKKRMKIILDSIIKENLNHILNYPSCDVVKFFSLLHIISETDKDYWNEVTSIFKQESHIKRKKRSKIKRVLRFLFSVYNENNMKVVQVLGITMRIKRK